MKEKPNEWVSISDLMASVTAAVMVLLIYSIVQSAKISTAIEAGKKRQISSVMHEIAAKLIDLKDSNIVVVNDSIIRLKECSFNSVSACLKSNVNKTLDTIAPIICSKLVNSPNILIFIEGHSDSNTVKEPVTDIKSRCACFDDNYTLSAGRAREVRKAVLTSIQGDTTVSRRIAVVGYGADRPLDPQNPNAAENRRVEIRLVTFGKDEKAKTTN